MFYHQLENLNHHEDIHPNGNEDYYQGILFIKFDGDRFAQREKRYLAYGVMLGNVDELGFFQDTACEYTKPKLKYPKR